MVSSQGAEWFSDLSYHCIEEVIDQIFNGQVCSNCVYIFIGVILISPRIECKYLHSLFYEVTRVFFDFACVIWMKTFFRLSDTSIYTLLSDDYCATRIMVYFCFRYRCSRTLRVTLLYWWQSITLWCWYQMIWVVCGMGVIHQVSYYASVRYYALF